MKIWMVLGLSLISLQSFAGKDSLCGNVVVANSSRTGTLEFFLKERYKVPVEISLSADFYGAENSPQRLAHDQEMQSFLEKAYKNQSPLRVTGKSVPGVIYADTIYINSVPCP